jgi:hypothetical protein
MKKTFIILFIIICATVAKAQTPSYPVRLTNLSNCITLVVEEYCIAPGSCSTALPHWSVVPGTPIQITTVPPGSLNPTFSVQNGQMGSLCAPGDEYYYRFYYTAPGCTAYLPHWWFGDGPCATQGQNSVGWSTPSTGCPCGTIYFYADGDGGLWVDP